MDDLHTGGILPIVYSRDCPTTWRTSVHSIGQGSKVYGTLLEEFPKSMGTQLTLSTTIHPQTNGQLERTIQILEDMLQACVLNLKGS